MLVLTAVPVTTIPICALQPNPFAVTVTSVTVPEISLFAVAVAKGDGVDLDPVLLESDSGYWPKFVSALFTDIENEDHLFALKLALFENEKIRDSENADLKAELRQGKTKADVLLAALKISAE